MQIQDDQAASPEHGLFSHPDAGHTETQRSFSPADVARNRTDLFHEPAEPDASPEAYSNTP